MSGNVPRIAVVDDPLGGTTRNGTAPSSAPAPAARAPRKPEPAAVELPRKPADASAERPAAVELARYPEANVSARVPAVLALRLKIAAAELSAAHGKVKVAELLAAILAHALPDDRQSTEQLEQLGEALERFRAAIGP